MFIILGRFLNAAALATAGITSTSRSDSVSIQAYWDAHPYLVILQHLLEVKAGMELTQCDVRDAQMVRFCHA